MISDEERREVAEKMRGYDVSEFKESAIVPFLDCLGVGYLNWREILDTLADLIDRPTCRIVHDENRDCDVCTNCSTSFELAEFDYADANVFEGYSYCPKCGAEVVNSDE